MDPVTSGDEPRKLRAEGIAREQTRTITGRDVIDVAVSILDAVDDLDITADQVLDLIRRARSPEPSADFRTEELALLAEVQPLLAAMDRHLQRMRARRASLPPPCQQALAEAEAVELTGRETEALMLLSHGLTATAAARRMACSTSTVNKHLGNVYRKLGVSDRLDAVLVAHYRGLLATPSAADPSGRPGDHPSLHLPSPRQPEGSGRPQPVLDR